jgi:N-acetylmuramoyl-L-alanine amidase
MRRSGLIPTAALLLLASACSASSLGAGAAPTPSPPSGPLAATAPAPRAAPAKPLTVTVGDSPALAATSATLRLGDRGPAVVDLQQRLLALGFWHDGADGVFGSNTHHAVVALQKYWDLDRDGIVGPQTWAALDRNEHARPFTTAGHLVEVDPRRQLVTIADDGRATWVLDSSTGAVAGSTPSGFFHVFREVNGDDSGPNGVLYRPKYFYQGVAVHGYASVPNYPASHGCVRVTTPAMDMLWASGALPIGTLVWVY